MTNSPWGRRQLLKSAALLGGAGALLTGRPAAAQDHAHHTTPAPTPAATPRKLPAAKKVVAGGVTPPRPPRLVPGTDRPATITLHGDALHGGSLPFVLKDGVKEFHLTAHEFEQEFAPGFKVKVWGYNGSSPGPTIEAVEGDRVRILVTNKLPEATSIHWHGVLLPSGMDGVSGLSAPPIPPGETWAYEFTLRQHGTQMYHPHFDEMVQMAVGMMGMFVIHPKDADMGRVDRDYTMMLHAWAIHPGTSRPDPAVMLEHDTWTINGRVFPAVEHMVVKTGQRVRLRIGNVSMHEHPMHIHGHHMWVTGTDGGMLPESARWPETTIQVPVGTTRTVEFVADNPGDWAFHCHKSHHAMNTMGHDIPNFLGVDQKGVAQRLAEQLPGYMPMGSTGMGDMGGMAGMMPGPRNTPPMMSGTGPYGALDMGGMVTVIKVRDTLADDYRDPGWYQAPKGTLAWRVS
ncbi:multicopper oxidase family protein [Azospirillum sp. B4]|uniref:multicopper oxidase family protein n=1 Tax=Azospirillum sp. B4 TaxID=95605 RepID=UPI000345CB4E|nr:copper oxidase [Azospirillum sp. B4]